MDTQTRHPMLVRGKHDELSRQQFVHNLRLCLAADVMPGNRTVYEQRVKPAFRKKNKRDPQESPRSPARNVQGPVLSYFFCVTTRQPGNDVGFGHR